VPRYASARRFRKEHATVRLQTASHIWKIRLVSGELPSQRWKSKELLCTTSGTVGGRQAEIWKAEREIRNRKAERKTETSKEEMGKSKRKFESGDSYLDAKARCSIDLALEPLFSLSDFRFSFRRSRWLSANSSVPSLAQTSAISAS
jgi:hypothetical protein